MAIPEDFKNELLSRVSISQVVGSSLTWDPRKSQPEKGDYWACCPFHSEKTPSFHVDDAKGYYYCFGCHEKGNAITYLRNTRNIGFREAIEALAAMVGMEVPKATKEDREKTDRRATLYAVCEAAAKFYREALLSNDGAPVRKYLSERGVSARTRDKFQIGFAPPNGGNLIGSLRTKGFSEKSMMEAGLVAKSDRDGSLYCRFRNRLMFPISTPSGRTIAFGGRALAANENAKYLNSPETEVFSKGSCLFNLGPARDACRGDRRLLVVEGYMDVISLHQSGIESCVAPLGTAVTESHLRQLWRVSSKPVFALDGDEAGMRAAKRVAQIALPHLQPGRSIDFCIMPDGADPDDLVRRSGPDAMLSLIAEPVPLAGFLWQAEARARNLSTPEARAEFEAALFKSAQSIKDTTVKRHYQEFFKERLGSRRSGAGKRLMSRTQWERGGRQQGLFLEPTPELRSSSLVKGGSGPVSSKQHRETFVLWLCLFTPAIVTECLEALENLEMSVEDNRRVLSGILNHFNRTENSAADFQDLVAGEVGMSLVNSIVRSGREAAFPAISEAPNAEVRLTAARSALIEEILKRPAAPK